MAVFGDLYQGLVLTIAFVLLSTFARSAHGQDCVGTLGNFETDITADKDNVDRLTGGFYPTNKPSPLVAEICYYINSASTSDIPVARDSSLQVGHRPYFA